MPYAVQEGRALFTDLTVQVCMSCPVVHARENHGKCLIVCREGSGGIVSGGRGPVSSHLPGLIFMFMSRIQVSGVLICGYSLCCSYFCYMERKCWCGGPFGLLFDFELVFPSEPHLFRQSRSQVQSGGAGGGSEERPAEKKTGIGRNGKRGSDRFQ